MDSYEAKALARRLLPGPYRLAAQARRAVLGAPPEPDYLRWIAEVEPTRLAPVRTYPYAPTISIVVPAFNTPPVLLDELVGSVLAQTYPHWQLCLVQGGSTEPARAAAIRAAAGRDARITLVDSAENRGIAGNTNLGIAAATGEFVTFLDHDDTLAPFALNEVVALLQEHRDADLVYSDEDHLDEKGRRVGPFFKPDWSPDLLRHVNYITHLVVLRASLLERLGGLREGFDGAQDYELLLRVLEAAPRVAHVPLVLYHWRMTTGSTAKDIGEKSYAHDASRRALTEHLARCGAAATLLGAGLPTEHRLRYHLPEPAPRTAVLLPGGGARGWPEVAQATGYPADRLQVVPADVTRPRPNLLATFRELRARTEAEFLLLTHAHLAPHEPTWLADLVAVAAQPGVALVSPWLFDDRGRTLGTGIVVGPDGALGRAFRGLRPTEATYLGRVDWPRNFSILPPDCLVVRADVFDTLAAEARDDAAFFVELGRAAIRVGLRNVFWPEAHLTVRGSYPGTDPAYNPNLPVDAAGGGIRLFGGP